MAARVVDEQIPALLAATGVDAEGIDWAAEGADPIFPTPFPLGEAAAAGAAAAGIAAAALWRARTGEGQTVEVSVPHAAASLNAHALQRVAGRDLGSGHGALSAFYRTRDDRWLHVNGGLPRLALGMLTVLDCGPTAAQLQAAIGRRDADELEEALAAAGQCGAIARTTAAWDAHPQGQAVADLGTIEIARVGDGTPRPAGSGDRPLAGLRVLELARILAGPTVGMTLAEQGADVLNVSGPFQEHVVRSVIDRGHGKRTAFLDLDSPDQAAALRQLALDADVLIDGYRAGALEGRGLGAEELAAEHPGLVYVTVNCYGDRGPWRSRAGFEPMGEAVSGLAVEQGGDGPPAALPAAACDYITGSLGTLGALAALGRRAREGGSYVVRVSLCQTAAWLVGLPRQDRDAATGHGEPPAAWRAQTATRFGTIDHLAPVARLSATPGRWERGCEPLGVDLPAWLPAPAPV